MKIYEAAQTVLKEAGKPMHARDIYRQIVEKGLCSFGAQDPVSIVSQSLRKKSIGARGSSGNVFKRIGPGTYALAEWRE